MFISFLPPHLNGTASRHRYVPTWRHFLSNRRQTRFDSLSFGQALFPAPGKFMVRQVRSVGKDSVEITRRLWAELLLRYKQSERN
jgi:hypothetical protein